MGEIWGLFKTREGEKNLLCLFSLQEQNQQVWKEMTAAAPFSSAGVDEPSAAADGETLNSRIHETHPA